MQEVGLTTRVRLVQIKESISTGFFPTGSSTTVGLWVSSLFFVHGRDLDVEIDCRSSRYRLLEWRDLKVISLGGQKGGTPAVW